MVVCKYFQQGNCRYGQYCKFEHNYGNRSKNFTDEKNVALLVAEEIVHAERGGQWMLSCYGPFKEKKCIPGMEDVSADEVRWEMYQAQKSGTVDQVNTQFQQMYEQMKSKREALKNPTTQIVQLLEEIQNSGSESSANKGSFPFGQSQLASSSNQSSNVFAQKSFGSTSSNPFGSTSTFNSTQPSSSIFGRTDNKPTFGGTSIFGGAPTPSAGSLFGGSKPAVGPFGAVQNTQTFGGIAAQGNSIFGGVTTGQSTFGGSTAGQSAFGSATTSQSTFAQPPAFGATAAQPTNSIFKPQGQQSSIFGGASTNTNIFGASTAGQAPAGGSIFGGTLTVSSAAPIGGGIFSQPATSSAFGAAPIFGSAPAFGSTPVSNGSSVFGGQATFGSQPAFGSAPSTNVFGGSAANNAGTATFGSLAAQGTNVFGAAPNPGTNVFAQAVVAPNASPFGQQPAASVASPFGQQPTSTTTAPFGTPATTSVFASTVSTTPQNVFGAAPSFGFAISAASTPGNVFGAAAAPATIQSVFNSSPFGSAQPSSSVFGNPTATINSNNDSGNIFLPKPQQNTASPFGTAPPTQANPFGNFNVKTGVEFAMSVTIDETAYSQEDNLTDEEKAAFKLAQFVEGHIPLKPPTKALC